MKNYVGCKIIKARLSNLAEYKKIKYGAGAISNCEDEKVEYENSDLSAPLSSGSFNMDAMVIVPCSMKTIAGIAHGYSENLILRAADVTLKEQRTLIVVPRETPVTAIHLRNLLELAMLGVIVLPAMPAFYPNPTTIDALVDFVVGKILDALRVDHDLFKRWAST